MQKDKLLLLNDYLKIGDIPILINLPSNVFEDSIILSKDDNIYDLNWYTNLVEKCKKDNTILVLDKINELDKKEQLKYVELIKYRKIGENKLPDNTIIVVTYDNLENNGLCEEVYSLLAHII